MSLLATSYHGIEQLLFVPVMFVAAIGGLICMCCRARIGAYFFAAVLVIAGCFALSFSQRATRDDVIEQDRAWGLGSIAFGLLLCLTRKPTQPGSPPPPVLR